MYNDAEFSHSERFYWRSMTHTDDLNKLWSGRFTEATDAFVESFTASVGFDQRLALYDIQGSIAHAKMLARAKLITSDECDTIIEGLNTIRIDIETGNFNWSTELEDVHMNIEARLTDRIGTAGKKLHTGRSRNDQVATDIRLYLRDVIDRITAEIVRLQYTLLELAEREAATLIGTKRGSTRSAKLSASCGNLLLKNGKSLLKN